MYKWHPFSSVPFPSIGIEWRVSYCDDYKSLQKFHLDKLKKVIIIL